MKLQNNMKDEEIKALRDRMIKMESIIPVQVRSHAACRYHTSRSGTAPDLFRFQDDDVNGEEAESSLRDGGGSDGGPLQPEVRVQKLMDEDPAFRRGRLRWLKQEQQRILNLQQQNITKKLRGQNQNQGQWLPFHCSQSEGGEASHSLHPSPLTCRSELPRCTRSPARDRPLHPAPGVQAEVPL